MYYDGSGGDEDGEEEDMETQRSGHVSKASLPGRVMGQCGSMALDGNDHLCLLGLLREFEITHVALLTFSEPQTVTDTDPTVHQIPQLSAASVNKPWSPLCRQAAAQH